MFSFDKVNDAVLIAGGTGFLGRHVGKELLSRGYQRVIVASRTPPDEPFVDGSFFSQWIECDFTNYRDVKKVMRFSSNKKIWSLRAIINLAASVGGIGANQLKSAEFMMASLKIGTNLVDGAKSNASMQNGGKFVQIGTVCAYPKFCPVPFVEDNIWNGYPEETNAPYGIAKKTIMELVSTYTKQYDTFNGINLIPVNLYGPGDNFNPESSHVIPALIRKFEEARENGNSPVTIWGTGEASREFLYVKDAARGIVDAMEKYEGIEPVNLGTGLEMKINHLVTLIQKETGHTGEVIYDNTKPDGQPRRSLDVSRAFNAFGFTASTDFTQGLKETIQWYRENK